MWVEVTFDRLTEQEKKTWKKYVQDDNTFCFRKTARYTDEGKVNVAYNGYVSEPEEEWLKADNAGNYTNREAASRTPLNNYLEPGRLSAAKIQAIQQQYIDAHREDLKFRKVFEQGPVARPEKRCGGYPTGVLPCSRCPRFERRVKSQKHGALWKTPYLCSYRNGLCGLTLPRHSGTTWQANRSSQCRTGQQRPPPAACRA